MPFFALPASPRTAAASEIQEYTVWIPCSVGGPPSLRRCPLHFRSGYCTKLGISELHCSLLFPHQLPRRSTCTPTLHLHSDTTPAPRHSTSAPSLRVPVQYGKALIADLQCRVQSLIWNPNLDSHAQHSFVTNPSQTDSGATIAPFDDAGMEQRPQYCLSTVQGIVPLDSNRFFKKPVGISHLDHISLSRSHTRLQRASRNARKHPAARPLVPSGPRAVGIHKTRGSFAPSRHGRWGSVSMRSVYLRVKLSHIYSHFFLFKKAETVKLYFSIKF